MVGRWVGVKAILVAAMAVARPGLSGLKGRLGARYSVPKQIHIRRLNPTIMAIKTVTVRLSDKSITMSPFQSWRISLVVKRNLRGRKSLQSAFFTASPNLNTALNITHLSRHNHKDYIIVNRSLTTLPGISLYTGFMLATKIKHTQIKTPILEAITPIIKLLGQNVSST